VDMKAITFGAIESLLIGLGFVRLQTAGDHRAFRHEETHTLIVLPGGPANRELDGIHRAMVRRMLDARGVLDGEDFDTLLAQSMATPTT
jgi:predicted RNA binding protein YcfA (HicA-like mRNA interferase family)